MNRGQLDDSGDILHGSATIDPAPTQRGKTQEEGRIDGADEPPELASFRWVEPVKGFILAGNFLGRSRRDTTEWLLKIPSRGRGDGDVIKHTPHDVFLSPLVPQRTPLCPRNLLPCVSRRGEKLHASRRDPFEFQYFRSIDVSPPSRIIAPVGFLLLPSDALLIVVPIYIFRTLFLLYRLISE